MDSHIENFMPQSYYVKHTQKFITKLKDMKFKCWGNTKWKKMPVFKVSDFLHEKSGKSQLIGYGWMGRA